MTGRGTERGVWSVLVAVVVAVVAAGLWSLRDGAVRDAFPVLGTVPDFTLTERSGRPLSRADLLGKVWVADFIFTRCSGVCPLLSSRMAVLQRALREQEVDARLVSFSVDPTHDTPEELRRYAMNFGADPSRWLFLTGPRAALYDLIGKGFLLSVAERDPRGGDEGELITHSDRFVLVDRQARIRGYYHGTEEEPMSRLVTDVAILAQSE
jgi:cytochrome oxidase Cu insertion factor (SCO1/SenC/PrrC family)